MSTLEQTRLYIVKASDTGRERLVQAASKARALRLAMSARVASPIEVARLLRKGVKPEGIERTQGQG
jgi:hypothetical protein